MTIIIKGRTKAVKETVVATYSNIVICFFMNFGFYSEL